MDVFFYHRGRLVDGLLVIIFVFEGRMVVLNYGFVSMGLFSTYFFLFARLYFYFFVISISFCPSASGIYSLFWFTSVLLCIFPYIFGLFYKTTHFSHRLLHLVDLPHSLLLCYIHHRFLNRSIHQQRWHLFLKLHSVSAIAGNIEFIEL